MLSVPLAGAVFPLKMTFNLSCACTGDHIFPLETGRQVLPNPQPEQC